MIWLIRFFLAMTIVGAPFVLESAFELYGLTLVYGPQMLFFSLAHTGGLLVPVLVASAIGGVLAVAAGVVMLAAATFGPRPASGTIRACVLITIALATHMALLATYDYWANGALARLVCLIALAGLVAVAFAGTRLCRLTMGWSGP